MGNETTITKDLRDWDAALEALVKPLTAQCSEKERVNAELTIQNAKLTAMVKAQAAQIVDLKDKLAAANQNSSNSSKPPSSDLFNPHAHDEARKKRSSAKRGLRSRGGGRRGRRDRSVLLPALRLRDGAVGQYGFCQQVERVEKPCRVTEFRAHAFYCEHCVKESWSQFLPGTGDETGERWRERAWTAIMTCR